MALRVKECQEEITQKILQALGEAGALVEASAKDNCPVDTGNLRASISTQLEREEKSVWVGTNVEYAPYVEVGTKYQKAQPYLLPALESNRDKIIRHFEGLI